MERRWRVNRLYREVSVKDRLPKNNGGIIAICSPVDGLQQLYFKDGEFLDPMDDRPMNATAWLEEFELPSDDEIEESGREGGLRDNELQLYWEGAVDLKRSIIGNTNQESEVTNG